MLSRVHLQRFKKFEDVEVILGPFTVLMGENSSGKTTVIQAINCALNSLYVHKLVYTDPKKGPVIRKKGVGLKALPGLNVSDFRELYYGKISRGGKTAGAGGATIDIADEKGNNYSLQILSLFGDFNIKTIALRTKVSDNATLHSLPPLFISGFVGLQTLEERAFPRAMQDRLQTGRVSEIIRNLVLDTREKKPDAYKKLKTRLEKDFDFYLDEIEFDEEHDLSVRASFQDICGDRKVTLDFNSSGSGFMQVLQILAPIYRFAPDEAVVVLLDEPDAHLHPNLQFTLARALRDIQRELNIQIIISTHSTSIIRASDPSEVVPISARTKVNAPLTNAEDVEEEISSRINTYELAKSKISGKLVFIEDENIQILGAFDKVLGTKCFWGANTVPVLTGRGRDDKMPFQIKKTLHEWTGEDVQVHFIIDGDGMNETWRKLLSDYAIKNNVVLHQLIRHEIESYLLNPNLIARTLATKHPGKEIPDTTEIESYILKTMINTLTQNKFNFDDLLEDRIYKTATLLGIREYRETHKAKSEAKKIRQSYENYSSFEELIDVAMGKETLKAVISWLNHEKRLNLSIKDILDHLEANDIPLEILRILEQLRSNAAKPSPIDIPSMLVQTIDEEEENNNSYNEEAGESLWTTNV